MLQSGQADGAKRRGSGRVLLPLNSTSTLHAKRGTDVAVLQRFLAFFIFGGSIKG